MTARVLSCATLGIDAYIVHIEADISQQLPAFSVVGLPDSGGEGKPGSGDGRD